jgi:hypothetical protein
LYAQKRFNTNRHLIVEASKKNIENATSKLKKEELINLKSDRVSLTNKEISEKNFNMISNIKNLKITKNNKSFIPTRVAVDIANAFILDNQEYLDKEQKVPSKIYDTVEEVFWGNYEEMRNLENVFSFCLLNDMYNDMYFSIVKDKLLHDVMVSYIPYAYNKALDELVSETVPDIDEDSGEEFYQDYPEYDFKEFEMSKKEALLLLISRSKAHGLNFMELFYRFIDDNDTGLYWSTKKSACQYQTKEREKKSGKTFERFDKVMDEFLETIIKPKLVMFKVAENDFGYRIYNIVLTDYSVRLAKYNDDYQVDTGSKALVNVRRVNDDGESVDVPKYLPVTDISPKYKNREEIIKISESYISSLIEIQKKEFEQEFSVSRELSNFLENDFDKVKLFES